METLTTYGTQTATTTWVHDPPTGLLLEKKYAGQTTGVKYTYTGDGKLASRTWRRNITAEYYYNTFGDLEAIIYSDDTPAIEFSNFDRLGRPGTVTEGTNVTTLSYDPLTGEASTAYAAGHSMLPSLSVVMKSPASGRPGGYVLKQGSVILEDVAYGYDTCGRFGGITAGANEIGYQYYPGTNILSETTHTLSGAVPRVETRAVDLAGRLVGVATTVPNGTGRRIAASAGYMLNDRGLREKLTREDGASWNFGYNDRGEVTLGVKRLADRSLAAGLQFGYEYDGIGNRLGAKSGGDSNGHGQRTTTYTPNALNQYTAINTPGSFDVLVRSQAQVGISVDGTSVSVEKQGSFNRAEAGANNASGGAWVGLDITSPPGVDPHIPGHRWLPPAAFSPTYDDDGNLTNDGRWTYAWNAENRLASMTVTQTAADKGAPKQKLEFAYDWLGRRIGKRVSSTTSATIASATWTTVSDERFVYNGWNPLAVFDASGTTLTPRQTYLWGLDLSGTLQGAGGVGGLLAVNTVSPQSACYPAYDGNGNIIAWTASNGDTLQRIDYDPFGNRVTREGNTAFAAPAFGFSTKYQDKETGLLYYGYRYYDPVTGRWPSRDPIRERGGLNLYGFVGNNGVNQWDILGNKLDKYYWNGGVRGNGGGGGFCTVTRQADVSWKFAYELLGITEVSGNIRLDVGFDPMDKREPLSHEKKHVATHTKYWNMLVGEINWLEKKWCKPCDKLAVAYGNAAIHYRFAQTDMENAEIDAQDYPGNGVADILIVAKKADLKALTQERNSAKAEYEKAYKEFTDSKCNKM